MLDYEYIRNHYKIIAADLSRQKELDADSKAVQQIELVGKLLRENNQVIANEYMFLLTTLEKTKETKLKFSKGTVTVL